MALMVGVMTLSSAIPVFAAPKQMADGGVFDAEYYAQNNPDVVAVFGTDENLLYNHYVVCGKNEGRLPMAPNAVIVPSETPVSNVKIMPDGKKFDYVFYAQNNPDVVAIWGYDEAMLYAHYKNSGKAEGRIAYKGARVLSDPTLGAELVRSYNQYSTGISKYRVEEYSNGISKHYAITTKSDVYYKYFLYRIDFSDGLIDEDGNGLDDRDPLNECGYTDLNYNAIIDGAPKKHGYVSEEESSGFDLCQHGVINGFWICKREECEAKRNALRGGRLE